VSGSEPQALISNAGLCSVINFAGSSSLTVQVACSVFYCFSFHPRRFIAANSKALILFFVNSPGRICCQFRFLCTGAPCAAVGFVDFVPAAWIRFFLVCFPPKACRAHHKSLALALRSAVVMTQFLSTDPLSSSWPEILSAADFVSLCSYCAFGPCQFACTVSLSVCIVSSGRIAGA
jgi:hypothetical protein